MPQTLRVELKGATEFAATAKKIAKQANIDVDQILAAGAIETQSAAQQSILSHLSKGEIYKRGSITHQASTAGNPPNSDTGTLVKNITVEKIKGGYDVGSRKGAPWGLWLEFGTSKVAARPWLLPAYEKAIKSVINRFKGI